MAFTNFYMDSGGHDMAAGTVQNAAASVTQTNGSWDITADTFIATAGTPFSAVNVGDWASIYNDGVTSGAVYVAQVTTINSLGVSITLSTTAKYGTKPASGATGKSCKVGGSWLTELPLTTLTGTVPGSTKINIKGNLTITANRTIALAGATTTPLWFSGYTTTPGDLDSDTTNTLAKPIWTVNSTFRLTFSGNYQIWSGLSITGSVNSINGVINATGSPQLYSRMRVENTNSGTSAAAFVVTGAQVKCQYCWFKAPTTATGVEVVTAGAGVKIGCIAEGGGLAGFFSSTNNTLFLQCIGLNNTGSAFLASTGGPVFLNCTAYNATVDGIKWTGTPGTGSTVIGCLFVSGSSTMTNGINNASGTNTANVVRACNDFYNVTNPEVGFGDAPAFFGQTESASPVVSSTNLTAVATANARIKGFPGIFENETYSGYADIGAVQTHPPPLSQPGLR